MRAGFPGFPAEGMAFFRGLKKNNKREWFQKRKSIYEEHVKAPMTELVTALNLELIRLAPEHVAEPERAIYRIYRDTRFSSDKTPYKTHIAASFSRQGLAKHAGAGYYCGVSPEEIEVGGGIYLPTPESLQALRRHVAENHEECRALCRARKLTSLLGELQGEQLARVPKGYPAEHPAGDLLRYKQMYYYITLDGSLATSPQLYAEIVKRFRALTPFVQFLNRAFTAAPALRAL
jgi:uncharacterized protein (TIGR02453 family)